MLRLRALPLLALTWLGGFALFVARAAAPETVHYIVPGVWFRQGDLTNLGHCNNVIIEMKDYLIVVDANFPSGARATMADVKRISAKPVKYVLDTHHHGDHLYGNPVWTEAGATTIGFKGLADEIARREPARWRDSAKSRPDVAELKRDGPEPPKQVVSEPLYVINDGSRKVEFRHYGWAHTRGDGFVYLPKEQVLVTGDAVVNGAYNFTGDANLANWPVVLRAVDKLNVKYLLPGHGPQGGRELLTGQAQFISELYKAVKAGIDAGKKPDEIQASMKVSDAVRPWISGGSLKRQVQDVYDEITKGKPRGDLP
jgi:cyclase